MTTKPIHLFNSHQIEGYGLHHPLVDGLLIARHLAKMRIDDHTAEGNRFMRDLDQRIEEAKTATR